MKRIHSVLAGVCAVVAAAGAPVAAAVVVAPNAYATSPGYEYQSSIFGNGSTQSVSFQEGFDASQFASVPVGATITGIGYRLASNLPSIADPVSYSDFTVRIGSSAVPIASLSTSKEDNLGADTITARSGAYTLPGGALTNTGGSNPFATIAFDVPFTYQGGDLLITTSYSVAGDVPFIGVDAVDPYGAVNTVGGNDPAFLRTHTFNAPVVQFTFGSAVPEPASWLLTLGGFGVIGFALRRPRRAEAYAI